ncbi:MAG: radical SAM protein, partial [Nanoarchaeota archaeon]
RKRIALINPPSFFLTDDKVFFSLGLLYIAGMTREAGHEVSLIDLAGRDNYEDIMRQIAAEQKFDIYGITSTSPQFSYATKILGAIKKAHPNSRVVVGGPHAIMFASLRKQRLEAFLREDSTLDESILQDKLYDSDPNFRSLEVFDQIVKGEELSIFDVLKSLKKDKPEKWIDSQTVEDLDSLPFPARDLIDMNGYTYKDNGQPKFEMSGGPATSVMSQRGCPFGCLFCAGRNVDLFRNIKTPGGKLRAHSPERMVTEFNMLNKQYGFTRFMIYDDEINLENRRFIALMSALENNNSRRSAEGLEPYKFRGFVKSELFVRHPEQAEYMMRAGFDELLSGFESGSARILKDHVKKNTTPEINYKATKLAFERGMKVKALTMIGHPTDTYDDVMATWNFLDNIGAMAEATNQRWNFDVTILTPYPGSPIYDEMVWNNGRFKEEFPRVLRNGELYMRNVDFSKDSAPYKTAPGEEQVNIRTETLSSQDLLNLRQEIDNDLRRRYRLQTYEREDIEHSMGQS